jgi:putative ABC transport system permease protein
MNLIQCIKIAFDNLRANKLRSGLTMLGIIIGVSAVIMMVAILQGMQARVSNEFQKMGSNLILIFYNLDKDQQKTTTRRIDGMTMDDVRAIREQCPLIKGMSPELQMPGSQTAQHQGHEIDATLNGVMPDYERLRNVTVTQGRFISQDDADTWAKVCVIGDKVFHTLFPDGSAIGQTMQVGDQTLTVVGVLAPKGQSFEGDLDKLVFVPLTAVQKRYIGDEKVGTIYAEPIDLAHMDEAKDQVWQLLMRRYDNLVGFRVDSLDNMLDSIKSIMMIFTIVLGSIAGLALLVGGIGIMNIMLVSVTERTREIGVRKAIGAKRKDILRQFLIESATLSGVGGLTGVAFGTAMAYTVGYITTFIPQLTNPQTGTKGMAMYVPIPLCIGAFAFSAAVGIFFGIYPAMRASALDPITALRHE